MASRLKFSATVTADKVGRAFIKAFYAQAYTPLWDHGAAINLCNSTRWYIKYLRSDNQIGLPEALAVCLGRESSKTGSRRRFGQRWGPLLFHQWLVEFTGGGHQGWRVLDEVCKPLHLGGLFPS
jgi:hypothetical protein